jgi:peptidoglycan/xylan/chitin deacetylase (PgdA/CDA1 family)
MSNGNDDSPPPLVMPWPGERKCAVSLCFDDASRGQLEVAVPALQTRNLRATFYLTVRRFDAMSARLRELNIERWATVQDAGHEIGNHTHSHPCSTNFAWASEPGRRSLEDLSLDDMAQEIDSAQSFFEAELGRRPTTFAYPCGMSFVGRGATRQSYVPLVADRFIVGRSFNEECAAAPLRCDLAHVPGMSMDDSEIQDLGPHVEDAIRHGHWLVLVGHAVAPDARPYVTRQQAFDALLDDLVARDTEIWVDTIENVGRHIVGQRMTTCP